MSIKVSGLTKLYGGQKAVNDISFSVNIGEIVGFLGPNGAGKSTTMKMITGYISPDAGTAEICGINVMEQPLETKKKIGYLAEANPLYYEMFVREYLSFIMALHEKDKNGQSPAVTGKQRIERIIAKVGLQTEAGKKIGQLSKGYKQRVGLAAALLHDPEVLILDEPTSGLDPNQIVEIRELIRELGKDKTVLFSSHIIQEVESICHRAIIINKGNIVADDTLENLKKGVSVDHLVNIVFKEKIGIDQLKGLTGFGKVQQLSVFNFQFSTDKPEELRNNLLELSLQNKWNIESLQSENNSLEEVFRELTNG